MSVSASRNRLGEETSPYLLQHRANPVHWQAWGPGALAEAYADRLDWHQIAALVKRGCPPLLALRIVR